MQDYRDLRFSVPGWWCIISFCSIGFAANEIHISSFQKNDWTLLIAVIALFVSGPAVSFMTNSIAMIFLGNWVWGHANGYKGSTDTKTLHDVHVNCRLPESWGGFSNSFHDALSRRWSIVFTCYQTTAGIAIGVISGLIVFCWKPNITVCCALFVFFILCLSLVFLANRTRAETIAMEDDFNRIVEPLRRNQKNRIANGFCPMDNSRNDDSGDEVCPNER